MSLSKNYGGAIWTNHALERLSKRGLSQDLAWQAFQYPDTSLPGKKAETTEYRKKLGNSLVTIVTKRNEKGEWIILSCWADPPFSGSIDIKEKQRYKKYQKASFLGKFWLTLKTQLGFSCIIYLLYVV